MSIELYLLNSKHLINFSIADPECFIRGGPPSLNL